MEKTNLNTKRSIWFPGETKWEHWLIAPDHDPQLLAEVNGGEQTFGLSARGERVLALPVSSVVALPLQSNAPNFSGLGATAQMQAERSGISDDVEGVGFEILAGTPPNTLLRVDAPLAGGDLWKGVVFPDRVCASAGLLPWSGDSVAIWRELGQLVVGFSKNGRLVFYDRLSVPNPGPECGIEIQRLLFQLNCQGIEMRPESLDLWTEDSGDLAGLQAASGVNVRHEKRPAPISEIRSDVSPAWLRDHRVTSKKRALTRKRLSVFAAAAMVVVGAFGTMGVIESLRQKRLLDQISQLSPIASRVENMKAQWREVAPAVDRDATALEVLKVLQGTSGARGVNFSRVEIGDDRIVIEGDSASPRAALQFLDEVTISEAVAEYGWEFDQPEIRPNGSATFQIEGVK